VAWLQRHVTYLTDPQPVEAIEQEQVRGMTVAEMEQIGIYQLAHQGVNL